MVSDIKESLKVTFKMPDVPASSYWIRMSQGKAEPESVTFNEAATVIDNLFDIDPCIDSNFKIGGMSVEEPENIEEKLKESFGLIEYDPCKFASENKDYFAKVSIFRSHTNIPYKLICTNGSVTLTQIVTINLNISKEVENASQLNVDYNIIQNDSFYCSEEVLSIDGSIIRFKKEITGFVVVSFESEYDLVTVHVNGGGVDNDPIECPCIAFYNKEVAEVTIEPPEIDEVAVTKIGCQPSSDTGDEEEEEELSIETCFQRVIVTYLCQCSETIKTTDEYVQQIPCPDPGTVLSGNVTEESAYEFWWEAKKVFLRSFCSSDNEGWEGSDREYYKEKCCVYPETNNINYLPRCEIKKQTWFGPQEIKYGRDYYVSKYGENLQLIPVRPNNSTARSIQNVICGEQITKYEVSAENCCDPEITPDIIYNEDESAEIIADNYRGIIYWEGGIPPFDIQINGQGFYLDSRHLFKSMSLSSPGYTYIDDVGYWYTTIYTKDACGVGYINITDGCSDANGMVLSDQGNWYLEDYWTRTMGHEGFDGFQCVVSGDGTSDVLYDQKSKNKAVVILPPGRIDYIPDPSIPRNVVYHTWGGYPGGTCKCNAPLENITSVDPTWGIFNYKIGWWAGCRDRSVGDCAGSQICWAKYLSTSMGAVEFRC